MISHNHVITRKPVPDDPINVDRLKLHLHLTWPEETFIVLLIQIFYFSYE